MKATWEKALELVVGDPLGWACPFSLLCHGHFVFSVPFSRHTESAHPLQDAPQESRPVNNEDREMSQHVRGDFCASQHSWGQTGTLKILVLPNTLYVQCWMYCQPFPKQLQQQPCHPALSGGEGALVQALLTPSGEADQGLWCCSLVGKAEHNVFQLSIQCDFSRTCKI